MEQTTALEPQAMRSNEYSDRGSVVTLAATDGTDSSRSDSNGVNGSSIAPVYGTRKSSRRLLQQLQQSSNEIASSENASHLHMSATGHSLKDKPEAWQDLVADHSSANSAVSFSSASLSNSSNITGSGMGLVITSCGSSNQHGTTVSSTSGSSTTTKHQRKWEMWQSDDSRWFFEALNEHGKDFNAIHLYMIGKLKKKGISEDLMKNKEQIRCYFNRQWNKISALLDLNNCQTKGKLIFGFFKPSRTNSFFFCIPCIRCRQNSTAIVRLDQLRRSLEKVQLQKRLEM